MSKLTVLSAALLAATLSACGAMQTVSSSSPNYNPYTDRLGPCPQSMSGDDPGGCAAQVAPTAQLATTPLRH